MHVCILGLSGAWLAKLSLKYLVICQDALLGMSSLNTCALRAPYIWIFPSFEAIALLYILLSGSLLLSAPHRGPSPTT